MDRLTLGKSRGLGGLFRPRTLHSPRARGERRNRERERLGRGCRERRAPRPSTTTSGPPRTPPASAARSRSNGCSSLPNPPRHLATSLVGGPHTHTHTSQASHHRLPLGPCLARRSPPDRWATFENMAMHLRPEPIPDSRQKSRDKLCRAPTTQAPAPPTLPAAKCQASLGSCLKRRTRTCATHTFRKEAAKPTFHPRRQGRTSHGHTEQGLRKRSHRSNARLRNASALQVVFESRATWRAPPGRRAASGAPRSTIGGAERAEGRTPLPHHLRACLKVASPDTKCRICDGATSLLGAVKPGATGIRRSPLSKQMCSCGAVPRQRVGRSADAAGAAGDERAGSSHGNVGDRCRDRAQPRNQIWPCKRRVGPHSMQARGPGQTSYRGRHREWVRVQPQQGRARSRRARQDGPQAQKGSEPAPPGARAKPPDAGRRRARRRTHTAIPGPKIRRHRRFRKRTGDAEVGTPRARIRRSGCPETATTCSMQ